MPPKKGESKQDFLGRCAREKRDAGMAEDKALKDCNAEWKQTGRLAAYVDESRMTLAGDVRLGWQDEDADQAPNGFAILAYTGKLIEWGWLGRFIIDLKGMKLAKDKVPCLYGHMSDSIVGTIDKASSDANGFYVFGQFSQVPTSRGPEVLAHAREGFPYQASIGVQGIKVLHVDKGSTHKVNGQTVEGPCDVWLESSVFEVSFVPFGADDDTAAIAMSASGTTISPEGNTMPGTATDPKILSAQLEAGAPTPAPAPAPDAAALAAANAEGAKLATQNAAALLSKGQSLRLSVEEIQPVLALGLPMAQATDKLIELAAAKNPPMGAGGRIEMGADEADKFRLAAAHGTMLRMGIKPEGVVAPGHEQFRGLRMHELAKLCLKRAGVAGAEYLSPHDAAERVLRLSAGGASTSDFAAIFQDAANKRLLKAFEEAGSTWRPWCSVVPATDFKEIHGISLSEAPDLDLVNERGEYQESSFKDKQESYHMGKYGKLVSLSMEMIVDDDLRGFQKLPKALGTAAARKESDVIYGLLTSNPVMKETGKTLFYSGHKNLASGADLGGVDSDNLSAARLAIRLQKGIKGAVLNLNPKYVLIPAAYETAADIILRSISLPESGMSSGVANPWTGKLIPISDARLDANSSKAWYMVADPNQIDTVEVAFLDGNEQPTLTEHEEYKTDAIVWKVRHIFGAGIMDYRGFYKNAGQ